MRVKCPYLEWLSEGLRNKRAGVKRSIQETPDEVLPGNRREKEIRLVYFDGRLGKK